MVRSITSRSASPSPPAVRLPEAGPSTARTAGPPQQPQPQYLAEPPRPPLSPRERAALLGSRASLRQMRIQDGDEGSETHGLMRSLRRAGYSTGDSEYIANQFSAEEREFALHAGPVLTEHGLDADDVREVAQRSPEVRDRVLRFMQRHGDELSDRAIDTSTILELAAQPEAGQTFVMDRLRDFDDAAVPSAHMPEIAGMSALARRVIDYGLDEERGEDFDGRQFLDHGRLVDGNQAFFQNVGLPLLAQDTRVSRVVGLAEQSPEVRAPVLDFLTRHRELLDRLNIVGEGRLDLACERGESGREAVEFLVQHGDRARELGFQGGQLSVIARLPAERRAFFLAQTQRLLDDGMHPGDVHRFLLAADNDIEEPLHFFTQHSNELANLGIQRTHRVDLALEPPEERAGALAYLHQHIERLRELGLESYERVQVALASEECRQIVQSEGRALRVRGHGPEEIARMAHDGVEALRAALEANPPTAVDAAIGRWMGSTPYDEAQQRVHGFVRQVIDHASYEALAANPESHDLLMLVAGLAFSADHQSPHAGARLVNQAREAMAYLRDSGDPELLRTCQATARKHVGECGDRTRAGLTDICGNIEDHKMEHGLLNPVQVLCGIRRRFNQMIVEDQGTRYAAGHDEAESVQIYLCLANAIRRRGHVDITETALNNLHNRIYDDGRFDARAHETEQLIYRHQHEASDEFRKTFENNSAVKKALQRMFHAEYEQMVATREALYETEEKRMERAGGDPSAMRLATENMNDLMHMEPGWMARKLDLVLRNPQQFLGGYG